MKVKLITSFLNLLFLVGSLTAYSQLTHSTTSREIKRAYEGTNVAVFPSIKFIEHETTGFPEIIFGDLSYGSEYAWRYKITGPLVRNHKPPRAFIFFRVLRN